MHVPERAVDGSDLMGDMDEEIRDQEGSTAAGDPELMAQWEQDDDGEETEESDGTNSESGEASAE